MFARWRGVLSIVIILLFFSSSFAASTLWIEPDQGRAPILNMIHSAKHSIHVVMYGFTDAKIANALIEAYQRGVSVRVLLQQYPYKARQENTMMQAYLKKAGVVVRWSDPAFTLTHQKTLVVDHKTAAIMTFNFTHATFATARNFALMTTNPAAVHEIEAIFNADWLRRHYQPSDPSLIWSPDNARGRLNQFIGRTEHQLWVYNQEISDYAINGRLAKLAKRGVKVKLIVPDVAEQLSKGKLCYLQRQGVVVRVDKQLYIHAKAMLRDYPSAQATSFVGSMNFSQPALEDNRELGMVVASPRVASALAKTFGHDWAVSLPLLGCYMKGHKGSSAL